MKNSIGVLLALILTIVAPAVLWAEVVTEVGGDGTMTLADGKRVVLAGVQMDAAGISVLRVLAQKQD